MYTTILEYGDDPVRGYDLDFHQIAIPTKKVVNETYCGGKYWKRARGFSFGMEDNGKVWWSICSPKMGRFEYRVTCERNFLVNIQLTDLISFKVEYIPGKSLYRYKDCYVHNIEDCIILFYLDNEFTRDKATDLTYTYGCRQYSDSLVVLK